MIALFTYLVYFIYILVSVTLVYFALNIFRLDRKYGSTLTCPDCNTTFKRPIITIREGSYGRSIYPYGLVQCPKCKKLHRIEECRQNPDISH